MNYDNARSALITGASRGIGRQIARRLASEGMRLTISSRSLTDLEALAPELRHLGAPAVATVAADMADSDTPPKLIAGHRDIAPDISALIINAGVGTAGPVGAFPSRRVEKTFAVNFHAPFALIQAALPLLRAAADRHGELGAKVVVLGSITGVYAEPGLAAYGASKAAVMSLVDALNTEESEHGVTASAIAPGFVDTDMSAWIHDKIPPETMIASSDIATIVASLLALSRRAMISRVVVARSGTDGLRA